MTKRMLFVAAVFVSSTMPVLANEDFFPSRTLISSGSTGIVVQAAPGRIPSVVLLDGALTNPHTGTLRSGVMSAQNHREGWPGRLSVPALGNEESAIENSFDGSSQRSFSSIVQIEDGVISISVPEPQTWGTLAIGLAMIALLRRRSRSTPIAIAKSFLH